jgi:hypothetical protein
MFFIKYELIAASRDSGQSDTQALKVTNTHDTLDLTTGHVLLRVAAEPLFFILLFQSLWLLLHIYIESVPAVT